MPSRIAVKPKAKELVITRIFDAPRELVFKAWTDPKHVAQWWGPDGFTIPVCELDVRPGGAMLIRMVGPNGDVHPGKGVYREVMPPERLVFMSSAFENAEGVFGLEVLHTITFADYDGKTKLTLHAVVIKATPEVAESVKWMETGWNQGLDHLAVTLKSIN